MKRIIGYISILTVLTGVGILCFIRWNAWFGNPPEPAWEKDTVSYHFYTFAQDTVPGFVEYNDCWYDTVSPDILRFIVLGDVHNSIIRSEWDSLYLRHPDIDFYAQVGDFLERGYFFYYQQMVSELQGTPFEHLPFVTTPGNHEYRKGIVRRLPQQWHTWFVNPDNGPQRFAGSTYYVDFASLRLIVIDTNGLQFLSDYTSTLTWLNTTLARAKNKFTMVLMHHPVYSGAVGRQNIPVYLFFRRALQHADIVFSGHDHNYNRRLPFVGINSAKKFYMSKVSDHDARICSGRQVYELCSVTPDTLRVETYLADGTLYDVFGVARVNDTEHEYFFSCDSLPQEIILLPDKYQSRTSTKKVQRFLRRKADRLRQEE